MNEQTQLKAFLVTLFIISVMALSQTVHAAMTATPTVSGYSSGAGTYSAPSGSFSTAANSASYGSTGVVSVGGKQITMPANLRMASNAGQFAKNAMRLNPWALAGTLAAGWLLDKGLEWLDGEWQKPLVNGYLNGHYWRSWTDSGTGCYAAETTCTAQQAAVADRYQFQFHPWQSTGPCVVDGSNATCPGESVRKSDGFVVNNPATISMNAPTTLPNSVPATPGDWDALPDPLPVVAPELPYAPYMPDGVPVQAPDFDFAPFTAPLGEPYTKPDGSTAQPSAKVSPNGDKVTIDTFDQPLTTPDGQPVANPQPQDTPEPAPDSKTDCDKYPTNIGCSKYGDIPAAETLPTLTVPVTSGFTAVGSAGMCPASVQVGPVTWSYQPFCDFASAIRPLIIGFAWLSFAFIVVGAVRT